MKINSIKGENLHIPSHGEPQNLGVVLGAGLGQDTDTHARLQEKKQFVLVFVYFLGCARSHCHTWDLDLVHRPAMELRAPAWGTES